MTKIKNYLLKFLYTQLLVTLFAFPILIHWGLSFSLMTFISNLIFAPVLMVVIILASLIFFTELLFIPNQLIVTIFHELISLWDKLLQQGSRYWLIEFAHPGALLLFSIPVGAFLVLHFFPNMNLKKRILFIIASLFCCLSILQHHTKSIQAHVAHTNITPIKKFSIKMKKNGHAVFVDNGYFTSKGSPDKAVEFELKPYITKNLGPILVDTLVLTRPKQRSFIGGLAFCRFFKVKKVVMPYFEGGLSKCGWHHFFKLRNFLKHNAIKFSRKIDKVVFNQ